MKTVSVSASRQYEILIERGLLRRAGELVRSVTNAGTVMLVSDDSVWPLYGETVQKSLAESGFSVCRFVFPHGENSKCAKTYLALLNALCENRLTRADAVVALGGGVVGDLTGFAASTYLRGIGFTRSRRRCWPWSIPPSAAKRPSICLREKSGRDVLPAVARALRPGLSGFPAGRNFPRWLRGGHQIRGAWKCTVFRGIELHAAACAAGAYYRNMRADEARYRRAG